MNSYTDLVLSQLLTSIYYAFIGLLVGSILVYVLRRFGYLKREYLLLKILSKLYYLIIPILFFIYFWFAGTIAATANALTKQVDKVMVELKENMYPVFADYINEQVNTYIHLDEIPSNEILVDQFIKELNITDGSIYQASLSITLEKILDYVVGENLDREDRVKALTDFSSRQALDYGFEKIRKPIQKEVNRQITQFLGLFLIPITITFFISMLIIGLETFVSIKYLNQTAEEQEEGSDDFSEEIDTLDYL